ncbi:MAG: HEPN domain-containing protein [Gammaproteobacteria bacterium]
MNKFSTSGSIPSPKERMTKAALIYKYAHTSATSLLAAFDDAKTKRGNVRGVLTDQEQDILRAALVMACAGLDGSLKQGIRDCLEHLLTTESAVRDGFEKFIRKRIGGENDILETGGGAKFLARILSDSSPRKRLIEDYIRELTGESLQSTEEVMRTTAALGINYKELNLDIERLKEVFKLRNKIIHELDINLEAPKRKRKVRSQTDLLDSADFTLSVTRTILRALNRKA